MKIYPLICPQCSASLQFSVDDEFAICAHCNTKSFIKKEQGNLNELDNHLKLAKVAETSGNFGEAYDLYSRVLIFGLQNSEAWRGKGYSAGMLSNLISDRLKETIVCYSQSLEVADEKDVAHLKMEYALSAFKLARSYFDLSLSHTLEFIGVRSAQFEHADRCRSIIELCEYALSLDTDLPTIKTFVNDVASRCEKITFLDENSKNFFSNVKNKYSQYKPIQNSASSGNEVSFGGFLLGIVLIAVNYYIAANFIGIKNPIIAFFAGFLLLIPEIFIFLGGFLAFVKMTTRDERVKK